MGKLKYPEASSYAVGVDEGTSRLVGIWGDNRQFQVAASTDGGVLLDSKPGSVSISRQAV